MSASFQAGGTGIGAAFSGGATTAPGGAGCGTLAAASEKIANTNDSQMHTKTQTMKKKNRMTSTHTRPIAPTTAAQTPKIVARIVPVLSSGGRLTSRSRPVMIPS